MQTENEKAVKLLLILRQLIVLWYYNEFLQDYFSFSYKSDFTKTLRLHHAKIIKYTMAQASTT